MSKVLDQFRKLVDATIEEAFSRVTNETFYNIIEEHLQKEEIFENYGLENVVGYLIQEHFGISEEDNQSEQIEESQDQISEDKLDQALEELEKEFPDLE